jgi:hypothetical protein
MSEKLHWNPDKADLNLAAEELRLGWTCPVQESDMSVRVTGTRPRTRISPARLG